MAHVEDTWLYPDGSKRPRHGQGKRWRVRWKDPAGRSKSFIRKTDADRFRSAVETDLDRGHYRDPRAGRITLRAFATGTWLPAQTFSAGSREATERRLRLHILPQLGSRSLTQLSPSVVQAWLGGLDAAPSTVRVLRSLLSSILAAAIDDGLIGSNPLHARSVKAPRLERRELVPWTAETVAQIRAAMPDRWAALVDVGAGLGLRIGEACGLAVDDVDFMHRRVYIRRQVQRIGGGLVLGPPKGGKERTVPLPDTVALALSAHIAACPPVPVTLPWKTPYGKPVTARLLFTMRSGRAVNHSWLPTAWHPALRAAGIEPGQGTGFHQLRHRYASTLLAGGVDVRTVSAALGHADPGFTLRVYGHLMPDAADRVRAAIDQSAAGVTAASQEAETRL